MGKTLAIYLINSFLTLVRYLSWLSLIFWCKHDILYHNSPIKFFQSYPTVKLSPLPRFKTMIYGVCLSGFLVERKGNRGLKWARVLKESACHLLKIWFFMYCKVITLKVWSQPLICTSESTDRMLHAMNRPIVGLYWGIGSSILRTDSVTHVLRLNCSPEKGFLDSSHVPKILQHWQKLKGISFSPFYSMCLYASMLDHMSEIYLITKNISQPPLHLLLEGMSCQTTADLFVLNLSKSSRKLEGKS